MKKPLFEHKTCDRCAGIGRYAHYGVCFKCGGAGHLLTKRGLAAQGYLDAMRYIPIEEFSPGMTILAEGFCAGSYTTKSKWHKVERVDLVKGRDVGYTGDSADLDCVLIVCDGFRAIGFAGITKYRRGFTADEKVAQRAEALAYQATLTKGGTVSKRASK